MALLAFLISLQTLFPHHLRVQQKLMVFSQWEQQGSGLEAADVDTVGLMFNYNFTDNLSLEIKGGIPLK